MSKKTKTRMAPRQKAAANDPVVMWSELDAHRESIIENVAGQSLYVRDFLADPAVAALIDSDKESKIIVQGFGKDIERTAEELNRIAEGHKDFNGPVQDHNQYLHMVQLFGEYNETALKFDHSLQTVVTEINSTVARATANQALAIGESSLHDEIMESGMVKEAIDITPTPETETQSTTEEKA